MLTMKSLGLGIAAFMLSATPAAAQERSPDWIVHLGLTRLSLADKIKLTFNGAPVPGAGIHTEPSYTPTVEVSRFVGEHLAVALTVGLPPHISIQGRGALQPFGKLAETTYGPAVLTLQYHPLRSGPVRPYVGAGAAYMIIFSTKDAAFRNVKIDNDLSPALEAGADIMVNDRFGIFLDAKKAFLRTTSEGTFGGAPVVGKVRLDPWAFTAGVTAHF
jgi:outer membrane protein